MKQSILYNARYEFVKINELYQGKPFFRKVLPYDNVYSRIEYSVYDYIKNSNKSLPNVVDIYRLNHCCIDMELLNTNFTINQTHINELVKIKQQLQHLGIVYIDWSIKNIGIDDKGAVKLFDFDSSGIYNKTTLQWVVNPPKLNNYNLAIKNNYIDPISMDNFLFHREILTH